MADDRGRGIRKYSYERGRGNYENGARILFNKWSTRTKDLLKKGTAKTGVKKKKKQMRRNGGETRPGVSRTHDRKENTLGLQ